MLKRIKVFIENQRFNQWWLYLILAIPVISLIIPFILKTEETFKEAKYAGLLKNAQDLMASLNSWDEDMIQRKSTSYDDVENFPNKFTANYMFLMNQTENDIFQVNQPSLDLLKTYTAEWEKLKARGLSLKNEQIPTLNKQLWELGMGVIW